MHDPYVITGFCLLGVIAACVTVLPAMFGPRPPKPEPRYVGKTLPDIEFNGVVIHPVRKTDKELEVVWTITKKD